MEAPFMMFFMLAVYYFHKWYYIYLSEASSLFQYRALIKCSMAISAACLTRYEGWLLPIGLIVAILVVYIFVMHERQKYRIEAFITLASIFSMLGIILWVLWNTAIFRDPLFFANGPYSAAVQAASRPYSSHLHMHPITSLAIIGNAASAMYGIPILIISLFGISMYLYMSRENTIIFKTLIIAALMAPILADFVAMLQGSGEIYPIGDNRWFNGRYLIFAAPLIAFGCASTIFYVNKLIGKAIKKRKSPLAGVIIASLVIFCYSIIFVAQPFEVGKTTAMSDSPTALLPSRKVDHFTYEVGTAIGRLYGGGESKAEGIVLLVPNQVGQEIMFASNLPLKKFIDVSAGYYWDTSRVSPWVYGKYLILSKPIQSNTYTTFDPELNIVKYWQTHEDRLLKFYRVNYENKYFCILIKK
jgi:hypothetical protein